MDRPEAIEREADDLDEEDLSYAARATNVQFSALGHYLSSATVTGAWAAAINQRRFSKGVTYTQSEARKWLLNAWNTETVLRQQLELDEDAKRFALQWAFSQAYYACFCQVLTFFVVSGQTQRSHAAVLGHFGRLVREGKYPVELTAYADGGMRDIKVVGLRKESYPSPLYLELDEPESVETQIAQFLKSTREKALTEKKVDFRFTTARGAPRTNLSRQNWAQVSESIGPTTVLNLLHRKRIKANYREIDTFLSTEISGAGVMQSLVDVVGALALVHEAMVRGILGAAEFTALARNARTRYDFVGERLAAIARVVA